MIDDQRPVMKTLALDLPTFGFVVATRAMLGVGIGLLLSGQLSAERRRAAGLTLIAIGAATTVPAIAAVLRARNRQRFDTTAA
jgi:energy-converting hydrogenase Eha subunit E